MAEPRRLPSGLVPRFPSLLADSLPPGAFHPVPIALGEVGKLCEMEQSCVPADLELIGQTGRVAVTGGTPADAVLPSPLTEHLSLAARVHHKGVVPFRSNGLRRPLWELLRPSVVIRRRPQRD